MLSGIPTSAITISPGCTQFTDFHHDYRKWLLLSLYLQHFFCSLNIWHLVEKGWFEVKCKHVGVCLFQGLSSESCADVVGQPHHGHFCFAGSCHRATDWGAAAQETIWTQEAARFTHHDEEHLWTWHLPVNCYLHPAVRWSVNTSQLHGPQQSCVWVQSQRCIHEIMD